MQTIGEFYHYAMSEMDKHQVYLGHGTDDIIDEAWWLVAGALKLPLAAPQSEFLDSPLTADEVEMLQALLRKRTLERIPTAYLLNQAFQNGYAFYVDERVLIPRSPIAELIENNFSPWISSSRVHKILDLCTGSGCLAILAAYAFPDASVDASDLSADALAVAAKNIDLHEMENQVRLIQSDVFQALAHEKYDVILSNPPYVDFADLESMPREYQHEPRMALEAGADGLEIVHRILKESKAHLNPGGILIVEVGNSEPALMVAYPKLPFIWLEFERGGSGVFLLREQDL